jgi:Xaa-Pro aminopeptidase
VDLAQIPHVYAGIPATNNWLYHQLRFLVGDPTALIQLPGGQRLLILRDIEMQRAKQHARVDKVHCPADFAPADGLSGDRETATAQAVAECLVRQQLTRVVSDRTLPLLFAHEMQARGIEVVCDGDLGVLERRSKDQQEVAWLRHAQQITEGAIELACRMIGTAKIEGMKLMHEGQPLTSERVRQAIDVWLLEQGFDNVPSIVAGGPQGFDCHDLGSGQLYTGQPVIVDIFPRDRSSRYHGDCTRTVVHGDVPEEIYKMHAAVVAAKAAATAACRAGATGEQVHAAAAQVILEHGYQMGMPSEDAPPEFCGMVHGTGHGIGLDVHEPPLLDQGGPELVIGDAVTIEPGLYSKKHGGIRIEDMVIVTEQGCENLNSLPAGLLWS